jgi:hypothetical protein
MTEFKIAVFVETMNNAKKLECELAFPQRICYLAVSGNALLVTTEDQSVYKLQPHDLYQ